MKRSLMCAIVAFCSLSTAEAGFDLRLDMSELVGTTAGNWNNIADVAGLTSNLIDFNTGLGTGVSIDGTGSPWGNFFGDDFGSFPNQSWLIQPATMDGAGLQDDASGNYFVAGLTDGALYSVEIVSARTEFDYLNTFTVNDELADTTYTGTSVLTPWSSLVDGLRNANWLIWNDVQSVGGVIKISNVAGPGTLGILNAMRIVETQPVPEPASVISIASGLVGLALYRSRRRSVLRN